MKKGMGWPIGVAVILGTTVVANLVVMRLANNDPAFAIEPDYYKKAVAFDSTFAEERRSLELGWTATSTLAASTRAGESTLTVRDSAGKVVLHAPVTSGSEHDPLPIGDWTVTGVSRSPTFNYNPDLFWDADPSHAKAKIPPGPNNPVGVAWIDISKPHYGIHGTPDPRTVGHTTSHGCVRLTNWDALRLAAMVAKGTKVEFVE